MIQRLCNLSKTNSFFLFGPRGTGKSTLLELWGQNLDALWVDLLDPTIEARYAIHPERLLEDWKIKKYEWIIIDEVQKNPKLLDVVQTGIVKNKIKFGLTGSSARRLRRGAGNMLGGRAFEFHIHPFVYQEISKNVELDQILKWGTLPEIIFLKEEQDKVRKLYSYVSTYLQQEILAEQIIRKIEPFRRFLEIAAQMNSQILNYAKIGREAGIEERSVARYFQILNDTLIGFFLDPFEYSIRKRQSQKAKFYFFDLGVTRALQNNLTLDVISQTTNYGRLFEQFFILECFRLNDYFEKRYRFSYLRTKDNLEVDLVIERPGQAIQLIEIKSKNRIFEEDCRALMKISNNFKLPLQMMVVSNQRQSSQIGKIECYHWTEALNKIFISPGPFIK